MIVIACAFVAGASGVADAASSNAKAAGSFAKGKKCGTLYTPGCKPKKHKKHKPKPKPKPKTTKPKVTVPMTPGCKSAGPADKLPTITFVSNAGLRKIKVVFEAKTLKVVTFKGKGPGQFKLNGVRVPTKGLAAGAHSVSVTGTDVKGKSVSKTVRFTICQAKPVFTG